MTVNTDELVHMATDTVTWPQCTWPLTEGQLTPRNMLNIDLRLTNIESISD